MAGLKKKVLGAGWEVREGEEVTVRALIGWLAAFVAGWAGWWLGSKFGFAAGVMLSAVTAGLGMYAGYRWFDQNLR